MTRTIKVIRWPSDKPGNAYWVVEDSENYGYHPLREFGSDPIDKERAFAWACKEWSRKHKRQSREAK